ncbi:hypothetical protein FR943_07495 [Mycobacterium sp. TNTM28]|uniref:Cellulose biosynthesis cyclic di-GMP-binding regulatory protein BcsB n=1 Tax=[Mycobacterium] fortunisiensis TaxID=2600579 RepID=A0ABS6KJ98_9MYCO|nr:cellulose biosynthesis cyclic di-GMP-binding regulatory protein BcsB [[Mycobacterium] fortunisiensis]MBU9763682.1 hypothetical protein [[Mycobacterium] fortunisiensis]
MVTRRLSRLIAVATIGALVLLLSPTAGAAPGDGLASAPTLSLRDLGSDPDIELYGQAGVQTIDIPVLPGTTPTVLNTTALVPTFVRTASLTVLQDNRVISRQDVPTGGPVPLTIPLAGVRVVDNAVTLMLRTYLLPLEGYCLDPSNPMRLTDTTVGYEGGERAPTAIADFLPPILRALTIYVAPDVSQGVADAAVQLAAAIAAHYGRQYPDISLARMGPGSTPPPGTARPFERQVVITEGPKAQVSLQPNDSGVPSLLVSGPANELTNQARLITSNVAQYALSTSAVAGPLRSAPQLTTNLTTIRKLGQPGVNSTAIKPEVYISLDQTRLGRASHNVRVHLRGSYTPLPEAMGGRLVASVGSDTIDRWEVTHEGVIDRWIDVPDRLLARFTSLRIQLDIAGNTGYCGEFQPLTLTIDGESEVSSEPASPPVPAGFQSLPQSLMPRVEVGIDPDSSDDTERAVTLIVGMQRLSALPLDTAVVPLQEAIDSPNPAVLIDADDWDHPEIRLPVVAPRNIPMMMDVTDDSGQPTTLTLEPALRFGSLQTVVDGKRSLLVATSNGAPEQLDELLRWLHANRQRPANLDGVAVISVPGRAPVTVLATQNVEPTPDTRAAPDIKPWWFATGVLVLLVASTAWWLWLRRRRSATPEE